MFKKPGPANSTLSISSNFSKINFLIWNAKSLGLILFNLPKIKAILQDNSKLKSGGGFSTVIPLNSFKFFSFKISFF